MALTCRTQPLTTRALRAAQEEMVATTSLMRVLGLNQGPVQQAAVAPARLLSCSAVFLYPDPNPSLQADNACL